MLWENRTEIIKRLLDFFVFEITLYSSFVDSGRISEYFIKRRPLADCVLYLITFLLIKLLNINHFTIGYLFRSITLATIDDDYVSGFIMDFIANMKINVWNKVG